MYTGGNFFRGHSVEAINTAAANLGRQEHTDA